MIDFSYYGIGLILIISILLLSVLFLHLACPNSNSYSYANQSQIYTSGNVICSDDQKNRDIIHTTSKIILYYAQWCIYSRQFLPEWEKIETYVEKKFKNVSIHKINCEGDNESICASKEIPGFPHIVIEKSNGENIVFEGTRTFDNVIKFLQMHC